MSENTKNKRNRRTKAEMAEHYRKLAEQYEAELDGKVDTSTTGGVLKALRAALRKRETELRSAVITLDGAEGRSSIDDKIAHTERRLESQRRTKENAEVMRARLPFDIERLSALVEAGEAGEEVEMPSDLTRLPGEQDRTDEEHEAAFIAKGEQSDED